MTTPDPVIPDVDRDPLPVVVLVVLSCLFGLGCVALGVLLVGW